jgi:hypothetical protein
LLSLLLSLRAQGSRTLIFSQSRVMLDLIEVRTRAGRCAVVTLLQVVLSDPCAAASALQLQEDGSNMRAFKCVRIDGSISSSSERQALIAQFNCDRSIDAFLLTTQVNSKLHRVLHRKTRDTLQCGGVGITLNGADRVVIFDPAWNPAVDAQVSSRFLRSFICFVSLRRFCFAFMQPRAGRRPLLPRWTDQGCDCLPIHNVRYDRGEGVPQAGVQGWVRTSASPPLIIP